MVDGFPALDETIEAALRGIAADPDPSRSYRRATVLGLIGRELLNTAGQARGDALIRLRDDHGLSLGDLAEVVGISKSRAAQLIKAVERELTGAASGSNESALTG